MNFFGPACTHQESVGPGTEPGKRTSLGYSTTDHLLTFPRLNTEQQHTTTSKAHTSTNKYDRHGIADGFAEFYEELCTSTTKTHKHEDEDNNDAVHDPGTQCLQPTQDRQGSRHESCQRRNDQTLHQKSHKHLPRLYNTAIKPTEEPPSNWRDTTIKVRYKSSDPSSPSNYRPFLYKLFSQLFFDRLQPTLDASQSVDQAGFKPGYFHDRTLFLRSNNSDREPPSGTSRFGTQPSTRLSTAAHGGPCGNKASGNTQGDPLGTLLFQSLLQNDMNPLSEKWNRDNYGGRLGEHDHDANLSNLRFADDIFLISGPPKHTFDFLMCFETVAT